MDNLYDILEVPKTATLDEIKKSYKRLALVTIILIEYLIKKKYHPDKNHEGREESKRKF